MPSPSLPIVYLAGPDVFRSNAAEYFRTLSRACDEFGMEALAPFDAAPDLGTPKQIFERTCRCCDGQTG